MTAAATRTSLAHDLRAIGIVDGDAVLVHAALRKVGPIIGGPDVIIDALVDVVGSAGTILGYCDWQLEDEQRDDPSVREHIPAFDPKRSRSTRDNGYWPECCAPRPVRFAVVTQAHPSLRWAARRSGSPRTRRWTTAMVRSRHWGSSSRRRAGC